MKTGRQQTDLSVLVDMMSAVVLWTIYSPRQQQKLLKISKISLFFCYPSHIFLVILHLTWNPLFLSITASFSFLLDNNTWIRFTFLLPSIVILFFMLVYSCFCRQCFLPLYAKNFTIRWLTHFKGEVNKLLQLVLNMISSNIFFGDQQTIHYDT